MISAMSYSERVFEKHRQPRKKWITVLGWIILLAAFASGANGFWIYGKAIIAQILLDQAWKTSIQTNTPQKPWAWADVSTVARLDIPELDKSLIVLNDASGEAMAFGPGLAGGDPVMASRSTIAIGGHRDTHMAFLEHLPVGAAINLENSNGQLFRYQLQDKTIVDSRHQNLQIAEDSQGLVLITCYPFNATQTGGPLRLVVRAQPFNR